MIVKRVFAHQLARSLPHHLREVVQLTREDAATLLAVQHVLIAHRSFLLSEQGELRQVVATADQTEDTRQHIHRVASLLTRSDPHFSNVAGLRLEGSEQAEVSRLETGGWTAKLEGTWYIFGNAGDLAAQDIPLGVTTHTLEAQLQGQGMEVYYLAQRQPKRVLGVFGIFYPILSHVSEGLQRLNKLGYQVVLQPSSEPGLDGWMCQQLPIAFVQLPVQPSLLVGEPIPNPLPTHVAMTLSAKRSLKHSRPHLLAYTLADVAGLCEAAHTAFVRTRRFFFWFKP